VKKNAPPLLVLLLALALCLTSLALAAEDDEEDDAPEMPTPVPLPGVEPEMPTPVPLPGVEPEMPTPVPLPGVEPAPAQPAPEPMPEPIFSDEATPEPPSMKMGGRLDLKTAADTKWDVDHEDVWESRFYGFGEATIDWRGRYSAYVSGLFEYRHDVADEARGETIPELRELYGKVRLGDLDLFFGQQIVSWGVADGLNPLDLLNPYDYARVPDVEIGYEKLGTFMIRPVYYVGDFTFEGVYLPVFTSPRYNLVGSDWAYFGQGFPLGDLLRELRTSSDWRQTERFLAHWAPDWQDDIRHLLDDPDFYLERTDLPPQDLTAPEAAARVKWTTMAVDVTVAYFYHWDDLPTLHINPDLRDLDRLLGATPAGFMQLIPPDEIPLDAALDPFTLTHHRLHTAGLGLESIVGDFGLRAEGAYNFGRYTYRDDLTAVRRDEADWVLNADYTFPNNVLFSALLMETYIPDREDDFVSRGWQHIVGGVLRGDFLDERLSLESIALWDLTYLNGDNWRDGDWFASGWTINGVLTYEITDAWKTTVGTNLFGGNRDYTPLGFLEGNSRVFGSMRFEF